MGDIGYDILRYKTEGRNILVAQGFWAIAVYRIGRYFYSRNGYFKLMAKLILPLKKISEFLCGITIPFSVRIGPGLFLPHFGCIFIHDNTVIGANCSIYQGVTIGAKGDKHSAPTIGDNVNIGAGAKVLGKIIIGNNVDIGANAVVLCNVPDNYIAVGVPARIMKKKHGEKVFA